MYTVHVLLFRPMSSVKLRRDFRGMDYSVQKKQQKTQYKHKGKTKQKNKILDNSEEIKHFLD
jgi:hypothetical protein